MIMTKTQGAINEIGKELIGKAAGIFNMIDLGASWCYYKWKL